jgi:hypothetical protein
VQFFNRGIKAHLLAAQHLIDDDHFVFTNYCGVGPIDLVRLNIHTGKTEIFDVKTDKDDGHRPRERTELQIKLGVKILYVNLHKRTIRVDGQVEELQT